MLLADALAVAPTPQGMCSNPMMSHLPLCTVASVGKDAIGAVAGSALRELAQGVVGAVKELTGGVLEFLATPVRPDLGQGWFAAGYARMVQVSGLFAVVFFLFGLTGAVIRGSLNGLGRIVGYTVAAFAASSVVLALVQGFVALVDAATGQIAAGAPHDVGATFSGLLHPLASMAAGDPGQALLAALLGIFVLLGTIAMYLELFIRNVMIHVVVYFVPLMLVASIWEATRAWARRAFEFLGVLIFSKFVLYAVVALGWSAVDSFHDVQLSTSWASVLTGLVLVSVAAFLPMLLFKLLPFMEAHVRGAMSRQDAGAVAKAPLSPVTSSMRTLDSNLKRLSGVALAAGTGGAGAVALGGRALAGVGGGGAAMGRAATGSRPAPTPPTGGAGGTASPPASAPAPAQSRPPQPQPHGTNNGERR